MRPVLPLHIKRILALALVAAGFGALDRWGARIGGNDPYAEELARPLLRVARAKQARHIVLGSSTSEWLPAALRQAWKLPAGAVVDAHMRDCHQTCTLAEVRQLVRRGYHYETAVFGINPFEYCEVYRARRTMQHVRLMPFVDSLWLMEVYWHSDDPWRLVGGFLLNHVSRTYGTTMRLQRHYRKLWFGNESLDPAWYRARASPRGRKRKGNPFRCDYVAARRDFGLAATTAATRALEGLADRVVVVLLPDRGLSGEGAEAQQTRALFLEDHAGLLGQRPQVQVVNLAVGAVARTDSFRDGAHLSRRGIRRGARRLALSLGRASRDIPPGGPSK